MTSQTEYPNPTPIEVISNRPLITREHLAPAGFILLINILVGSLVAMDHEINIENVNEKIMEFIADFNTSSPEIQSIYIAVAIAAVMAEMVGYVTILHMLRNPQDTDS